MACEERRYQAGLCERTAARLIPLLCSAAKRGVWMLVQKVPQGRDEMPGLRNIAPPNRRAELVHQHVSDLLGSVHALEQRCPEHNGKRISDVLVLGNGMDLIGCEI